VGGGCRIGPHARTLQAEISEELDAMLPAILDKVFKGEL
jgi:hypothetical protein